MGETYWERRRRQLNEDHAARRAASKGTMGLLRSQERIDRLTAAINTPSSSQSTSEEFRRLGVEWMLKKTATLQEIAGNPFLAPEVKADWCQVLETTTLTDSDDESLTGLRARMFLEALKPDFRAGRSDSLGALVGSVTTLIDIRGRARAEL